MAKLLCIGEVIVEMVAEKVGQAADTAGNWVGPFASGAPAILADQAALCGADVAIVGTVGADAFGDCCLNKLRADGVNIEHVAVDRERSTGVAFVRYFEDGSRSFIYHIADSASGAIGLGDADRAFEGIDCVHIMGSSAFSHEAANTLVALSKAADDRGIAVSFDPNIRKEMLNDPDFVEALRGILDRSSIVLASEGELPILMDVEGDLAGARALLAAAAKIVVLKRGPKGSMLLLPGAEPVELPSRDVKVVDPTGAGDCFGGTFLALHLQGWDPVEAARYATLAGELSVQVRGPMTGNRSVAALREHMESAE